ncbi:MAG: metallophosphoesterase [Haloquadratum sp.]
MDDVEFRSRGVYLPRADALVVADLHVGRDEASDVAFPLGERRDLTERLRALLSQSEPASVVFAGDVLHSFGTPTERARESLRDLVATCRDAGCRPVFVRGNHDTALESALASESIPAALGDDADAVVVCDDPRTVVCHGHEAPGVDADRYVVGHGHPAIAIEGQRRPCFLSAPNAHRGADLLMVPAFSRLAPGVEINGARTADLQSPLLPPLDEVRPVVYDDESGEALAFPPLGEFRRLL